MKEKWIAWIRMEQTMITCSTTVTPVVCEHTRIVTNCKKYSDDNATTSIYRCERVARLAYLLWPGLPVPLHSLNCWRLRYLVLGSTDRGKALWSWNVAADITLYYMIWYGPSVTRAPRPDRDAPASPLCASWLPPSFWTVCTDNYECGHF